MTWPNSASKIDEDNANTRQWNELKRRMKCLSPKGKTKQTCWMDGKVRWAMSAQQVYDVIEGGIFCGTLDCGKTESTVRQSCDFTSFFLSCVCCSVCASSSGGGWRCCCCCCCCRLCWCFFLISCASCKRVRVCFHHLLFTRWIWNGETVEEPLTKKKLWMKMWIRMGQICV